MQRNKKIPILSDFTPQGLLIIGLFAFGVFLLLGSIVAIIIVLV